MINKINTSAYDFSVKFSPKIQQKVFSALTKYFTNLDNLFHDKDINMIGCIKKQKTTLNFEKYIKAQEEKTDSELCEFFLRIAAPDIKPSVLAIKDRLMKEFGIKKACLDNNISFAKKCLTGMEILKDNNLKCPNIIIGSKYIDDNCISLSTKEGSAILVGTKIDTINHIASTKSPLHAIIHESIHTLQKGFFMSRIKKLKGFDNTVEGISLYASNNYLHEVHAELYTKLLLSKTNKKEKELLEYLNKIFECS